MGNVVSLKEFKNRKEDKKDTSIFDEFEQCLERNKRVLDRLKKERTLNNQKVLRQNRIRS